MIHGKFAGLFLEEQGENKTVIIISVFMYFVFRRCRGVYVCVCLKHHMACSVETVMIWIVPPPPYIQTSIVPPPTIFLHHMLNALPPMWLYLKKGPLHLCVCVCVCVCVLITQSCLILCDCMDCSRPGSFVHGIL